MLFGHKSHFYFDLKLSDVYSHMAANSMPRILLPAGWDRRIEKLMRELNLS
jgi:hypothetical protein